MNTPFVNEENTTARPDGTYGDVIKKIAAEGVCPFCPENLSRYHKKPIVEKKYWLVTTNMYPYKPSLEHRLLISKEHLTHVSEVTREAWSELLEIIKEETRARAMTGGTFMMRFGDTKYTGASVVHLHANLIQSDPNSGDYDPKKGLVTRIG